MHVEPDTSGTLWRAARTLLLVTTCAFGPAAGLSAGEINLEVREAAGVRRFSYPVAFEIKVPQPVPLKANFRLLDGERPIAAQFRPVENGNESSTWWVDFNLSLLPREARRLKVEYGADVESAPNHARGHKLIETDEAFMIANEPHIAWVVPRDLKGLLQSVAFRPTEFLRGGSAGLTVVDREGRRRSIGAMQGSVVRSGRLGVALRFQSAGNGVAKSMVDLYFPVSKSWVEVDWTLDDPQNSIAAMEAGLNLALDRPTPKAPTLVDFGAGSLVYLTLPDGGAAELVGGPAAAGRRGRGEEPVWKVLRGSGEGLQPFVSGPLLKENPTAAEGWAHLMDRRRCLALAVNNFSRETRDCIRVSADGAVTIARRLTDRRRTAKTNVKRLRFWLHFVFFPPHESAATSPQAMQNPLEVRQVEGDE